MVGYVDNPARSGLARETTRELRDTMEPAIHIPAREQSEKLLHESEHRFRSLTNLSNDWYWEQDENLRFTFLSSKFYEKSGLTATSTIGKTRWETADIVPLSGTW